MARARVIVVGTGPAGVRCAETLVAAGLTPTVVDEGQRDGGQIYRRQPDSFTRPYAKLYGSEANKAQDLHRSFEAIRAQVDYRPQTLAWNVTARQLHVVHDGNQTAVLPFDALVVCSGATDRLMPVEGWHLAGCYSLGASQIALKAQACAIGRRVIFMGSGPLLYLVASQYVQAGAKVLAVLDTSRLSHRVRALPALAARPGLLLKGIAMNRILRQAGVAVHSGITPLRISGDEATGVQGLNVRTSDGSELHFECDAVALGYHLRPESQLADLARCEFAFDSASRQWLPKIDSDGRSTTPGVYLAGDGARILGADGAEAAGRLAALAVLSDLGRPASADQMSVLRRSLDKMDRFRRGLIQAFPWPHAQAAALPDAAVVCRCEMITAGELRRVVHDMGGSELNRAKAFSRVGMGRCQGRFCGHAAAELVAHAAGVPIQMVGRLRGQGPVKPLPMAALENAGPAHV